MQRDMAMICMLEKQIQNRHNKSMVLIGRGGCKLEGLTGLQDEDEYWKVGSGEVVKAGVWMRWTG